MDPERQRLSEADSGAKPWRKWGPYLSERQWGTVREDYSPHGTAWEYLPHDHARSRAYRWGEDGLGGICDDRQLLCFGLALWNGRDPILKERLFGLTGNEGNHGEDVKELYYYLDAVPTASWLAMLYKYPQAEFPYRRLVEENRRRGREDDEYELLDTGVFDGDRYFDVFLEVAKAAPEDLLLEITAHNRGPETASLHLLPQVWFRNTWAWEPGAPRPEMHLEGRRTVALDHPELGLHRLACEGDPEWLFTENETNARRLWGSEAARGPFKDAFHEYVVDGRREAVSDSPRGTKAAAHHTAEIAAGGSVTLRLRLWKQPRTEDGEVDPERRRRADRIAREPFADFGEIFERRREEADAFYAVLQEGIGDEDARRVQRQALAGMLWSLQLYHFDVARWLDGDPAQPPPPPERREGRNHEWRHLNTADVISMPDTWEYPWFAAWDLAFHAIPLAMVDPELAKKQLVLLTREWTMHPNGQLPAYEWAFGDVNPPVHAWAAWRVYKIDQRHGGGRGDLAFLERVFHKLLLNFTWWVNRKDPHGDNLFQGGFLGLDNIGVFDRSAPLPTGGHIEQADGTAWMAMYCLNLLRMALELAQTNPVYQDLATKFFEHFLHIAAAMTRVGDEGLDLWNDEDEFFYDVLHYPDGAGGHGEAVPLRVRSMVGLIPLFAAETLEPAELERAPEFARRLAWFLEYRPDLASLTSRWHEPGVGDRRLLALLRGHRMKRVLARMLDTTEFLSDHGVRALSRWHAENPYVFHAGGREHVVTYEPGESRSGLFGGNSNWRGPVWFPVNFLIIESLQKFHHYYGDDFKVECPTGSGTFLTLEGIAEEITRRLTRLFLRGEDGRRPVFGGQEKLQTDPHFRDHLLFYEYFHGEDGRGIGASHQTGWTGVVAKLLQPRRREAAGPPQPSP